MTHDFATCPAYLVPVEIRETPQYGKGHRGVFAAEPIAKGTKLWVWTDRVTSIHRDDLEGYIADNFGSDLEATRIFLRQGFVLPQSSSSETLSLPQEHQPQNTRDSGNSKSSNSSNSSNNNDNSSNRDDDFFHSNPTDSGRLTNHSPDANTGPDGALRDILPGEELTIDYSFHGNPEWYRRICAKYGVATEAEIAALCRSQTPLDRDG